MKAVKVSESSEEKRAKEGRNSDKAEIDIGNPHCVFGMW